MRNPDNFIYYNSNPKSRIILRESIIHSVSFLTSKPYEEVQKDLGGDDSLNEFSLFPEQVDTYLQSLGFIPTSIEFIDGTSGNPVSVTAQVLKGKRGILAVTSSFGDEVYTAISTGFHHGVVDVGAMPVSKFWMLP